MHVFSLLSVWLVGFYCLDVSLLSEFLGKLHIPHLEDPAELQFIAIDLNRDVEKHVILGESPNVIL